MSAQVYNLKQIQPVPSATDFIDIVLSKTMRKTPTVVHKHYQISRIRAFYMRKVKFTQESFEEKLGQIISEFPRLDDIHPFYADLINVLYDRDHYKIALGQVFGAKGLISNVGRDYNRLLKFGDSLYRCKQLKKAALGRMATIMKKQKETLAYLEQVRQHLGRLPAIDPNTRTLLVCGYPNCGKSSFINNLTRAEVDVQPYAFTTKSLFIGHMDYKYLRWQVIDTPGILDHPLEDRNTIEMLSITALAHLRACILYFMDLTEDCGYSIKEQVSLFKSIQPLFANKPLMLVINKIDKRSMGDLTTEERAEIDSVLETGVEHIQVSCHSGANLMEAKQMACDKLLTARVENKLRTQKVGNILDRIHVAMPQDRDEAERKPFIPESMAHKVRMDVDTKLEKEIEKENGGAGVYNVDLKKRYMLANDEWKNDIIPEIMDAHNIADFIDPDIMEKLDALEREEEAMVASGHYESEEENLTAVDKEARKVAQQIKDKRKLMLMQHRLHKPALPAKHAAARKTVKQMSKDLNSIGHNTAPLESRGRTRRRSEVVNTMEVDTPTTFKRAMSRMRSVPARDRSVLGLKNNDKSKTESILHLAQRPRNKMAKAGEADRVILTSMPKHLFSGKRGFQAQRR